MGIEEPKAAEEERSEPPPQSATGLRPAFERVLTVAEHPVLEAHVLDGRPVLPLALTLEWLAQAALHHNPGLAFHGCNELRVLHGVVLDGPAPTLRVTSTRAARRDSLYLAAAELRGTRPGGREVVHARAEIVLAATLPVSPPPLDRAALSPYPHTAAEVYQVGLLFHGPELQGIERVEGCGERGIAARFRAAPPPAEWVRQPLRQKWVTDPLALDCCFQLMILWARQRHGAPGLPCLVGRYRQYRRAFPADGVRADLHVTRATGLHAVADADLLDAEGQVVARLEGLECAIDPGLERAFRNNQLTAV